MWLLDHLFFPPQIWTFLLHCLTQQAGEHPELDCRAATQCAALGDRHPLSLQLDFLNTIISIKKKKKPNYILHLPSVPTTKLNWPFKQISVSHSSFHFLSGSIGDFFPLLTLNPISYYYFPWFSLSWLNFITNFYNLQSIFQFWLPSSEDAIHPLPEASFPAVSSNFPRSPEHEIT